MISQAVLPNNTVIGYTYDANNRRIAKMVNGSITERFLYKDQLEPVAKIDGNGDILELYIYGEKGHVPGYIVKGGQTYRVISDLLGSVRMIVNANTGDIAQEITYNEFGIVLTDTNPGFQPFYFAGGIYDLDTQLVKFGARDYDPETGRWISKEPLGFAGSNNFYAYVDGDPVNYVDVSGLAPGDAYSNINVALFAAMREVHLATSSRFKSGSVVEWATILYMVEDEYGQYFSYSPLQEGIKDKDGAGAVSLDSTLSLYKNITKGLKAEKLMFVHSHPQGGELSYYYNETGDIPIANLYGMGIMAIRYDSKENYSLINPQNYDKHQNDLLHQFQLSDQNHLRLNVFGVFDYFKSVYGE